MRAAVRAAFPAKKNRSSNSPVHGVFAMGRAMSGAASWELT